MTYRQKLVNIHIFRGGWVLEFLCTFHKNLSNMTWVYKNEN